MTVLLFATGWFTLSIGTAFWFSQVVRSGRGADLEIEWTLAGALLLAAGAGMIYGALA